MVNFQQKCNPCTAQDNGYLKKKMNKPILYKKTRVQVRKICLFKQKDVKKIILRYMHKSHDMVGVRFSYSP